MRLWLACAEMQSSGILTATQTAPLTPGPLPIISIFLYQVSHYAYSLFSCTRTLKGNIYKTSIIHYSCRIYKFLSTAECCFSNSNLVLIHISNYIVCIWCLFYTTQELTTIPIMYFSHTSFRVCRSREMI